MFSFRRICIGAALGLSLLACRPAMARTNLLVDPGFNPTSVSAWNFPRHGTSHLTLITTGTGGRGGGPGYVSGNIGELSQHLSPALPKGVTYFITGYYKGTALSLTISLLGATTGTPHISDSLAASTYKHFSVSIVPTYAVTKFHARINNNGSNRMQLDDLGLYNSKPVLAPEVDTAAGAPALALALGGLALMSERRRRREIQTESSS